MNIRFILCCVLPGLIFVTAGPLFAASDFLKGVDLSITPAVEQHGVQYKAGGVVTDPLLIFKQNGCNCVRLRLFVNPSGKNGQVNTLAYTIAMARRVKKQGLGLYLDFHYSDEWADPGHEHIPAQWKQLAPEPLVLKLHDYTRDTLKEFKAQGCLPDLVSVGNEITNGMMWPAAGPLNNDDKWPALITLLKAGVQAVRETAPPERIKVMIHLDRGGDRQACRWYFDRCQKAGLDFDVIGLSYYPFWHGPLSSLKENLAMLADRYHKDIIVVETAYNHDGQQGDLPYPTTPQGQKDYLEELMKIVAQTPGGHGKGVFYWEPGWIQTVRWNGSNWGGDWEHRALFDADGNALPAIGAFKFNPPG